MRKTFTLLFLLGIFGLFTTSLFAQQDATIDPANIRYWIGEGENEVVFIVNWNEPDTAMAWGFRFDGESVIVKEMMDKIAEADGRFSYSEGPYGVGDINYNDGTLNLGITAGGYWMYNVDGAMAMVGYAEQELVDGNYVKWGDTNCGTMIDPESWTYVWEKEVVAIYTYGVEATIDPANIRFWIGEGEHEVVFAVNWNDPDTCLAWGYRFNEETVTVNHVMADIKAADPRFDYSNYGWGVEDIYYVDGVLDLSLSGSYWMYNVNGIAAELGFNQQTVEDGDFIKWGDESCGVEVAPWSFVWESEVGAVYTYAEEALIDFSEILYWVGEGANEVVMAVNWNEPNRCLAWGYRFDGETVILKEVMDAIAEVDRRFSYTTNDWGVADLIFNVDSEALNYHLVGMYWLYNLNGSMAWFGYDQQPLIDGDFVKWGDVSCGTEVAEWSYVWTQEVEPVWMNTGVGETQGYTLSVYPNPAVSETFVTIEDAGMTTISVYDMQGRMVSTMSVDAMAGEQVRLGTEKLNAGVYFITMGSENAVRTAKLVVK